jgi:ribonuclease BN (tRNA processing enzyme)
LKYKFNELRHILIECNYSEEILQRNGVSNEFLKNRTINSHMSYETCCSTLIANDLSLVQNIVLIHLSDRNSDANMFRHGICELTNKNVYIADSGLEIELNKTPF